MVSSYDSYHSPLLDVKYAYIKITRPRHKLSIPLYISNLAIAKLQSGVLIAQENILLVQRNPIAAGNETPRSVSASKERINCHRANWPIEGHHVIGIRAVDPMNSNAIIGAGRKILSTSIDANLIYGCVMQNKLPVDLIAQLIQDEDLSPVSADGKELVRNRNQRQ